MGEGKCDRLGAQARQIHELKPLLRGLHGPKVPGSGGHRRSPAGRFSYVIRSMPKHACRAMAAIGNIDRGKWRIRSIVRCSTVWQAE